MARRALTLLELLLALSLLLAIWALVLPVALESLRERAFEANAETIHNQLLLARAHAGATGRPVEISYEPSPSRIEARYFQVDVAGDRSVDAGTAPSRAASPRRDVESAGALDRKPEPAPTTGPIDPIVESWADTLLPEGFTISAAPADQAPTGGSAAAAATAPSGTLRLAIFMPDGSALLSRPVWVGDAHGRQAKLTINPWTGLSSQERSAASEVAGAGTVTDAAAAEPPPEDDTP
jgi:type II secretory pathway pseudopilin PulG